MGGSGNYKVKCDNTIFLTFQEHYEAHKLLAEENPDNTSLQRAWYVMSHRNGVQISEEEYSMSKSSFIKAISGDNSPSKRPEVRQHMVEGASHRDKSTYKGVSRYGELNPNYNNHKLSGSNHPLFNTHRSDETKSKISKTRIDNCVAAGVNNPRARKVVCVETGIIFDTGKDAAMSVNGSKSGMCRACKSHVEYKSYH